MTNQVLEKDNSSLGVFCLPFHWSVSNKQHTWEFEKTRSINCRYRAIRIKVNSKSSHQSLFDIALTVDEQIGLYSIVSHSRVLNKSGNGLKILRENKQVILDLPQGQSNSEAHNRTDKNGALVFLAMAGNQGPFILNLKKTECITLAGIVLSCLADNLGVTDESVRHLIQQWRQS
ncbi:hypothetical protein [Reinekea sp. G2M2-21]|uniref:hypothetical protein n=1 Tax=Reinekea sp. G2M2-21 TaxID=2788942 RepID=UPI0018AC4FBF|nr:hypothetical protein [Reinekea sp. G2M2-21]